MAEATSAGEGSGSKPNGGIENGHNPPESPRNARPPSASRSPVKTTAHIPPSGLSITALPSSPVLVSSSPPPPKSDGGGLASPSSGSTIRAQPRGTEGDDVEMGTNPASEAGIEEEEDDEEDDEEGSEDEEGGEADEEGDDEEGDEEDDEDDDDEGSDTGSEDLEPEITEVRGPHGQDPSIPISIASVKAEPTSPHRSTAAPTDGAEGDDVAMDGEKENVLVPKKKRKAKRALSEDEDLPPPPPPMKTIRLEVTLLPEGQTLEYNVLDDARAKGMVEVAWEEPEKLEEEEAAPLTNGGTPGPSTAGPSGGLAAMLGEDISPEEMARRLEEKYGDEDKPKKKKAKIQRRPVDYDLDDPFIDDSELVFDAPTHVGRPKKEGFYVCDGDVELQIESPVKARSKPKKPRPSGPATAPKEPRFSIVRLTADKYRYNHNGTRNSPIPIDSDNEGGAGSSKAGPSQSPRKPSPELEPLPTEPIPINKEIYKNASKDPRYLPPYSDFPDPVRRALFTLREANEAHDWTKGSRNKFPDVLRPILRKACEAAYQNGVFGPWEEVNGQLAESPFFESLTSCLPYNKFTLTKLATKQAFDGAMAFYQDVENTGTEVFRELVDKEAPQWTEKYEDTMKLYRAELEDWTFRNPNAAAEDGLAALPNGSGNAEDDGEGPTQPSADGRPKEPPKRFVWTAEMREVFAELVDNFNLMLDMNKKAAEWSVPNAHDPAKEKQYGRAIGNKKFGDSIVKLFPPGYCNNAIVSREKSNLTIRQKKAQQSDT